MSALNQLADITEKDWSAQVADLAKRLGWLRYHTHRSERSAPGFPDETLVRDRVIFLELKSETGKLATSQIDWLTRLFHAHAEVYIARPRHLQLLAQVLGRRYRIETPLAKLTRLELGIEGNGHEDDEMPP